MSVKITLELPDELAQRADAAGLLNDAQIARLIEAAVREHAPRPARFSELLPVVDLGPWPEGFVEEREGRDD
jgi:hypothetical protein